MMASIGSSNRRRRGLVTYIWDRMVGQPMSDEDYYRLTSEPGPDGQYDRSYTAAGDLEYFRRRTRGVPISTRLMFILDGMLEHEFQDQEGSEAPAQAQQECQADQASCNGEQNGQDGQNLQDNLEDALNENVQQEDEFGDAPSNEDMLGQEEGPALAPNMPENQDNGQNEQQNGDCQQNNNENQNAPAQNASQNERAAGARQASLRSDSPFLNHFLQNTRRPNTPYLNEMYESAHRISMRYQNEFNQTAQRINNLMGQNAANNNNDPVADLPAQNNVNQNEQNADAAILNDLNQNMLRHNISALSDILPRSVRQNMSNHNSSNQNTHRHTHSHHDMLQNAHRQNISLQNEIIRNAQRLNLPLHNETFHRDHMLPYMEPYSCPGMQTFQEPLPSAPYPPFLPSLLDSLPGSSFPGLPPIIDTRMNSSYHFPMFAQNGHQMMPRHVAQIMPTQAIPLYFDGNCWQYAPQFMQPQVMGRFNSWGQNISPYLDSYPCMPPPNMPPSNIPRPNVPRQANNAPCWDSNVPDLMPDDVIYPMVNAALTGNGSAENADLLRMLPPGLSTSDVVMMVYENMISNGYTTESAFGYDTPQAARLAARRRAARCRTAMRDAQLNRGGPQAQQCAAEAPQRTGRPAFAPPPIEEQEENQANDAAQPNAPDAPSEQTTMSGRQSTAPDNASSRGTLRSGTPRQSGQSDEPNQRRRGPTPRMSPSDTSRENSAPSPALSQVGQNHAPLQNDPRASAFQPATRRTPPVRPPPFVTPRNPAIQELTRRIVRTIADGLQVDMRDPQTREIIRGRSDDFEDERAAAELMNYRELIESRRRQELGLEEPVEPPSQNGGRQRQHTANRHSQTQTNVDQQEADLLSASPTPTTGNEGPRVLAQSSGDSSSEFDGEADRWSVSSQHTDDEFL